MSKEFILLLISYFLLMPSVVGIGYLCAHLTNLNKKNFSYGYFGIMGCFFLILYSYVSHFFISHNLIHNSVLLFVGITSFLFLLRSEYRKKEIIVLIITFFILYICLLSYKTNDDFPYYHFAYTYYLNQNPIILGIGKINHGFSTPSSIFYLNSLFYLPFIKYFSFQMSAILFMGFTITILITEILNYFKTKKLDFVFYFSLLSLAFICTFFYRISEHGTDRSAQILIYLFIIELIILLNNKNFFRENYIKIIMLLGLIVSLKAFFALYSIFFIFIFIYLFFIKRNLKFAKEVLKNIYSYFTLILVLSVLSVNLFNTGCFLYPVSFTCIENFSWSINIDQVKSLNNWYELWSKAGANPNYRTENPEIYIQNFNWVSHWFNEYFFNKVSDFLLGLIVLSFIFFLFFWKSPKLNSKNIDLKLIYFLTIVLFIEWFYNHPSLKYGGYILITLLVFMPIAVYINKSSLKNSKALYRTKIFIIIIFSIFIFRNIDRIIDEKKLYDYNPLLNPYYKVDSNYFKIDNYISCLNHKNQCKQYKFKVKNFLGRFVLLNND